MAKVTVIPSTLNLLTKSKLNETVKRRVGAYARVSTDEDEQYTSYEAQVNYYTKYIKERPDWEYVNVYSDEGITGTNTKRRDGFNNLIKDALAGKIDLIITKSISRFARNTLDAIGYIRKLKAAGVEVYFEKENLWSFDSKSELVLTICASIAQEESRSISQNVTMGKRWSMQEGKVSWAYKSFLGYRKTESGEIEIVEEEAKIVRLIYRLFLVEGKTASGIASFLNNHNIPTPTKREGCKWTKTTVDSILTNEKYKGDALLQKTFMVDYLEHKAKKNEGEVPSYYVENSHPHIIEKEEWEMVQAEFARRATLKGSYSGGSPFTSKLICADCGGFYGAKVWHSNDKYRRVIFRCNRKFDKTHAKCQTPVKTEEEVKQAFLKAYEQLSDCKAELISDSEEVKTLLCDTTEEEKQMDTLAQELTVIAEMVSKMIKENARTAQSQEEYSKRYEELTARYEKTKSAYDKATEAKNYKGAKALQIEAFIASLKKTSDTLLEWDDDIWNILVESGTVHRDGSITFKFKNGKEITV